MKRRHLTIVLLIVLQMSISSNAQDNSIEKFQRIQPMISTKDDVRKLLGDGKIEDDSTWYYFEDQTIEIVYSDGTCTENWLTKKDNVVEVSVSFIDRKDLGELKKKVRLDKLRSERSFDVDGEMYYFDDTNGIRYDVNTEHDEWLALTYYPTKEYSKCRC